MHGVDDLDVTAAGQAHERLADGFDPAAAKILTAVSGHQDQALPRIDLQPFEQAS